MLLSKLRTLLKTTLTQNMPVREYQLILAARETIPEFPKQALTDHAVLFKCHFLIRHALYALRNEWRETGYAELKLSALLIEKKPFECGICAIERYDWLADFYLDLSNLERMTAEQVEWLLCGFWDRLKAHEAKQHLCAILELPHDTNEQTLIKAWRRSTMQLHPDKGGDIERFKQVQSAYDNWRRPQIAI